MQVLLYAALALPMAAQADVQQFDARIPVWVPATEQAAAHTANLAGHVYRPQGTGPWPLVVLSHGTPSGAEARAALTERYGPQAVAIAALGYVVVTGCAAATAHRTVLWPTAMAAATHPTTRMPRRKPHAMWQPS